MVGARQRPARVPAARTRPGALTRTTSHEPVPASPATAARAVRGGNVARRVSGPRAINRRVVLSRHRIITRKRNKLVIVTAAGALTVATAASAAAAAWPSGSRATPAGTAFAAITAGPGQAPTDQHVQNYLAAQHVRAAAQQQALQLLAQTVLAHQQAAARQAAAAQAAKRQAQAALAAKQAAARQAAQQAAQQTSSQPAAVAVPAAAGSAQSVAKAMLGSFGWSSGQFSCLQPLWAGESGWRVTATNPSTGAYGIPQAMPGSKMASAGPDWQTNAATQIRWGLTYIKSTYGSPCAAWSHAQADGWY